MEDLLVEKQENYRVDIEDSSIEGVQTRIQYYFENLRTYAAQDLDKQSNDKNEEVLYTFKYYKGNELWLKSTISSKMGLKYR